MPIHYRSTHLDNLEIFRSEEVQALRRHAARHPLHALTENPRWKEESAIDFTYTSAQLEGNTYSRGDTITLLKTGMTAGGKAFFEAQMIMNLRDTYAMLLDRAGALVADPIAGIRHIHRSLMHGLLPEDQLGATRKTRNARIGGSDYMPPDGVAYLEKEADRLFSNLGKVPDAFSASLYVACNLSYLQFFEDGNKRTSRVLQNAVLIAADLPPVQFPASMNGAYIEAQLNYYETGDYLMHRGFMLDAYRNAYPLDLQP